MGDSVSFKEFQPYPKYKDSEAEWLGEIPEGWEVKRVKHLGAIRYGLGEPPEYIEDGLPFIRATDIKGGTIDLDSVRKVRSEDVPWSRRPTLQLDEILVVRSGAYAGDSAIIRKDVAGCIAGYDMVLTITKAHAPFVAWVLLSKYMLHGQIYLERLRAAQPHLNAEELGGFVILMPPLSEQLSIASFLDRETSQIDTLISEKERLISLLQEYRQALISHAVTKGLDPKVKMKDSGVEWLGEIPEHWRVKPFKACIDFQEGPGIMATDFHQEGIPLLRISGVQGRWATLDGCNYLDPIKVAKQWAHFRLCKDDLLISASASMGTCSEVSDDTAGSVAYTGLIRLRGRNNLMVKPYIRSLVVSSVFATQIELFKAGSAIQHFGPTHLGQMLVICPPIKEQQAIADQIDSETSRIDTLISEARKFIDLLKEYRSSLISAAVTGKIDVREVVPSGSEKREIAHE